MKELEEQLEEAISARNRMELALCSANTELETCKSLLAATQEQLQAQTGKIAGTSTGDDAFASFSDEMVGKKSSIALSPTDNTAQLGIQQPQAPAHQVSSGGPASQGLTCNQPHPDGQILASPVDKDRIHDEDLEIATARQLEVHIIKHASGSETSAVWHSNAMHPEAAGAECSTVEGSLASDPVPPHVRANEAIAAYCETQLPVGPAGHDDLTAAVCAHAAAQATFVTKAVAAAAAEAGRLEALELQKRRDEEAGAAVNIAAAHQIAASLIEAQITQMQVLFILNRSPRHGTPLVKIDERNAWRHLKGMRHT